MTSLSAGRVVADVVVVAFGQARPQGSKNAVPVMRRDGTPVIGRNGRPVVNLVESSDVKPWREAVKTAAIEAMGGRPALDGPLVVRMVFTVRKPASAPKLRRSWPDRMPDLSKLVRAVEDALTDAGVWADDARVIEYQRTAKVFPGEDREALPRPGVRVTVTALVRPLDDGDARASHPSSPV